MGGKCGFVLNPSIEVEKILNEHLVGQDRAKEIIVNELKLWHPYDNKQVHQPMVLAFTGLTGTGKTMTATLIADALFNQREKLENSDKTQPAGLLMYSGADFEDTATSTIKEFQENFKTRLGSQLQKCSGVAVVVFDEIQKVIPQVVNVLVRPMSEEAILEYKQDNVQHKIDCSKVIFILISDIGTDAMTKLLLQYDSRDEIPLITLSRAVKSAMDEQWHRLQLGKAIHTVVPFLPLEEEQEGVTEYFSRSSLMTYSVMSETFNEVERKKVISKYGARTISNDVMKKVKAHLSKMFTEATPCTTKFFLFLDMYTQ
ncbi:hypothetical protein THRCLA_09938 [Thraustotheca clavata]|uniref:AAA+ ATPase domain-containing protein n=1 Tax=Thraustotheca clavata TaxID=74557 RepID=A0A1V9YTU9_9STRA|nr:hypothetical protein THRCLA_09938 [Thraustotheca clavata]